MIALRNHRYVQLDYLLTESAELKLNQTPGNVSWVRDETLRKCKSDARNTGNKEVAMLPLQGVKVIDLTTFLATPTTGRVLGEWGADVIKIEAAKGDPGRVNQAAVFGMPSSDEENLGFDMSNMHKRFISLNLKSEKGIEIMYKLLADADIFITNTRTKSLKKMGLDWETLHEKFPRLIMGHGLGYGKKGPEKDAAGFDVTCYMGRGGVFGTTVNKGDAPMIPTNGYGDFQCSLFMAAGLLAALRRARDLRPGRLRHLRIAACWHLRAVHGHGFRPVR